MKSRELEIIDRIRSHRQAAEKCEEVAEVFECQARGRRHQADRHWRRVERWLEVYERHWDLVEAGRDAR